MVPPGLAEFSCVEWNADVLERFPESATSNSNQTFESKNELATKYLRSRFVLPLHLSRLIASMTRKKHGFSTVQNTRLLASAGRICS